MANNNIKLIISKYQLFVSLLLICLSIIIFYYSINSVISSSFVPDIVKKEKISVDITDIILNPNNKIIKLDEQISQNSNILLFIVSDLNCFTCVNDINDYIELINLQDSIKVHNIILYSGLSSNEAIRNIKLSKISVNFILSEESVIEKYGLEFPKLYLYIPEVREFSHSVWISKDITSIQKKKIIIDEYLKSVAGAR